MLNNFNTDSAAVFVNGRQIKDWGETDPPFKHSEIDPKRVLRRGIGGNAIATARKNPGRRVTLSLNPGGDDASFLSGLYNSDATINLEYAQIGTAETAIGAEGLITSDGESGRGGVSITDAVYTIEFNLWSSTK